MQQSRKPEWPPARGATVSGRGMHAEGRPQMLFVIGSGRSGTTLANSLLGALPGMACFPRLAAFDPRFTPVASYLARYTSRPAWLLRDSSEIVNVLREAGITYDLVSSSLCPVGAESLEAIRPELLQHRVHQLLRWRGVSTAVLKNTLNVARVGLLSAAFPEARFIHIVRDPADVVRSLERVEFWMTMPLWWDGRTVSQYMHDEGVSSARLAARHWARQVHTVLESTHGIESHRIATFTYREMTSAPAEALYPALAKVGFDIDARMIEMAAERVGVTVPRRAQKAEPDLIHIVNDECGDVLDSISALFPQLTL